MGIPGLITGEKLSLPEVGLENPPYLITLLQCVVDATSEVLSQKNLRRSGQDDWTSQYNNHSFHMQRYFVMKFPS